MLELQALRICIVALTGWIMLIVPAAEAVQIYTTMRAQIVFMLFDVLTLATALYVGMTYGSATSRRS